MTVCHPSCWQSSMPSPRTADVIVPDARPIEKVLTTLQIWRADYDAGLASIKSLALQQATARENVNLLTEQVETMLTSEGRQAEIPTEEDRTAAAPPIAVQSLEIDSLETPSSNKPHASTPMTQHRVYIATQLHGDFRNRDTVLRNVVHESRSRLTKSSTSHSLTLRRLSAMAASIVADHRFEYFISFVIFLNALCIGAETEISLNYENVQWPESIEYGFLVIYTCEIMLRLIAHGRNSFGDLWFDFDVVLVVLSLTGLIVTHVQASAGGVWNSIMVLRSLRLLRLARALRMVHHFQTVWRLVYGLFTSTSTVASTCLLLVLSLYIFSCLALELVGKDASLLSDPEAARVIVSEVYFPLIIQKPELSVYFIAILLFISVSLMNLVTAVIVEGALSHSQHEEEQRKTQLKLQLRDAMPRIVEMFEALDVDRSGEISRGEIENIPLDILPVRVRESVSVDSMLDLFALLDIDGTGSLSREEFVEGILNLFLLDVPVTTIQTLRLLRACNDKVTRVQEEVTSFAGRVP
eukprot:TRINITY_DN32928_c0_g1_i1.p1 TRINITY_DN32928_c0_g1~~TRINITY_DN32928_c0_g1_i1.p1  ORF type:complete len:525 (+),score=84.85 TRINITY_DN32928_c0_g1_i1:65-1639(+)